MIKRKHILFIASLIIVIGCYFYTGNDLQERAKNNFKQFNASNLDDELIGIDYYAKGIKIIFADKEFVLHPITDSLNEYTIFEGVAEKGDYIIKKPFQKILIVKKKTGKEYRYNFREF